MLRSSTTITQLATESEPDFQRADNEDGKRQKATTRCVPSGDTGKPPFLRWWLKTAVLIMLVLAYTRKVTLTMVARRRLASESSRHKETQRNRAHHSAPDQVHALSSHFNQHPRRELVLFQDVSVGKYHSHGTINVVCFAELPDWYYTLHSVPKSQKYLMKLTTDLSFANKEIDALKRLNSDKEEARRVGILPLIASTPSVENPFYCENQTIKNCSALNFSKSFPRAVERYLRKKPQLAAYIVPYKAGKGYPFNRLHTLQEVRHFMKSMLEQLAHAHGVGINYLDLSGNRNVFVDHDGSAILFDWNGALAVGEKAYNSENNFAIIPPEAWMRTIEGHDVKMTSISAWDVWSAGILFARLIFYPCRWATHCTYPQTKDRIRETILAVGGGNTTIPVDDQVQVDLAEFVGLNESRRNGEFKPLLVDKSEKQKCNQRSFGMLIASTNEERSHALDFLESMMKISPLDRPDCYTLLQHPFLNPSSTVPVR